jgi:hypothetical protein
MTNMNGCCLRREATALRAPLISSVKALAAALERVINAHGSVCTLAASLFFGSGQPSDFCNSVRLEELRGHEVADHRTARLLSDQQG